MTPNHAVPPPPHDPVVGERVRLLALSTSGEWCSVALHRHDHGIDDSECLSERLGAGQSGRVLAMVRELCDGARLDLPAIDAIAFDAGPGSFTGLRIGCAVAQGLGFALRRPLLPVDATATLAWQRVRATRCAEATVLVANDARMDELYVALYRIRMPGALSATIAQPRHDPAAAGPVPRVEALLEPHLIARAGFPRTLAKARPAACDGGALEPAQSAAAPLLLGGDAWQLPGVLEQWTAHHRLDASPVVPGADDAYVRADALAELALHGWRCGGAVAAAAAAPRYVRDKVALDRDEQQALRVRRASGARG